MKKLLFSLDDIIAGIAFVITIVVVVVNVMCRYLFNVTFQWAEELASICFVWVVFVGAAAAYKHNMHIGIDIIANLFKGKAKTALVLLVDTILVVTNFVLVFLSAQFAIYGAVKPTGVLRIPYTYINIAATVGFTLMTIYSIGFLITDIKKGAGKEVAKEEV